MKIPYQGQMIEVAEIDPVASREEWNEYKMPNGEVLLIKTILVKAMRAKDIKAPNGTPLYSVNTQPMVKVKDAPASV